MATYEHSGMRIHYEESGEGEPVLLMPGWGGTIDELTPIREALARDFRVIAADLPGSGKSGPQPRTYTPNYYRDDVPLLLALLKSLSASPAHLVGFSDGGEYALLMAATKPGAVRSIVAWGAAGSLGSDPQMGDLLANLIDDPIPPMADYATYMKAAYGEDNARVMVRSAGASIRAMIEAGGDISRSRAHEIVCPTLLITGEHDFLATPDLVSEMAGAVRDGAFLEAKGAGHAVHHHLPEWLLAQVTAWMATKKALPVA